VAKHLIRTSIALTAVGILTSAFAPALNGGSTARSARPPAPQVTAHGNLYHDLLPSSPDFLPIAVWDQGGNAPLFRSMGINVFLGMNSWPERFGSDNGELASAVANHMYVIGGGDPTSDTAPESVKSIAALMAKIPGSTNYFIGYQWIDEPSCSVNIGSQVATINSESPGRLTYANEGAWTAFLPVNTVGSETCLKQSEANLVAPAIASSDDYAITDPWHSQECIGAKCIYLYGENAAHMRALTGADKPVWEFVESGTDYGLSQQDGPCDWATNRCVHGNEAQATPPQVNSAAWEALIGGANGIEWFCDERLPNGKPIFDYCGSDATIRTNLTYIDDTIARFAPEINADPVGNVASVRSSNSSVPILSTVKQVDGHTYLMVESNRQGTTTGTYTLGQFAHGNARLLYDSNAQYDRSVSEQGKIFRLSSNGTFSDSLPTYFNVKIYEINPGPPTWWGPR
jgi:hypothetical protein